MILINIYLLGQATVPQDLLSSAGPTHWAPPDAGGGLLQVLVRVILPPPQLAVHLLYSLQREYPPSTVF